MSRDADRRRYNGLNAIDLLGDGHRGQVIVSRRENRNARQPDV